MGSPTPIASSFRDPSGYVYRENDILYRFIAKSYADNYQQLMESGLYEKLVEKKLLIEHREVEETKTPEAYKTIQPAVIPFVSHPYEWCFGQLQAAALCTLEIQKIALDFGMTLKDASAFNIQFLGYQPRFIDTLSFESYREGQAWLAYRQFCEHFLAPLALMSYCDQRLSQMLCVGQIEGVSLDLASSALPLRARLQPQLLTHLFLHAKFQGRYSEVGLSEVKQQMSKAALLAIVDSLESIVRKLRLKKHKTIWSNYYQETNYSDRAFRAKEQIVSEFLDTLDLKQVWDLGSNTGLFSRIASKRGALTVSFERDPLAVEKNYRDAVQERDENLLPLILDLTNPTPGAGWENRERESLIDRSAADLVMALALIHHLAIANNLPFEKIAAFFARLANFLIIEFVPKSDSQVERLLLSRPDIYDNYSEEGFREAFGVHYETLQRKEIADSSRSLYLMRRR